jgi:hypothetical protein
LPFEQQLKHHIDYVFAVAEDTNALRTRHRGAMMKFVQNLHPGYKLSEERTMKKILTAITDTQLKEHMLVISAVTAAAMGGPAFGLQFDLWTKRKLRDAFMSLRLTYVTEDADGPRRFHDVLLKFGHFPKLRHTAKAIAKWVLHALASVELTPADITLATPDGAAAGLKALQMMGVYYDACVEHQFDRAVKNATGEAGKDGGDNPHCHALIMANRKMVSKILTSTQLQEGLRRHQLEADIRKRECLVVIKYGATRWASGHLLINRSCMLYHVTNRLAQENLGADPDLVAGLRGADLPPDLDEDRARVGDHVHVPSSDDDDDSSDDDEEKDLRKLTLSDCNLTATQWSHSEIYEGLFNPAREAMTKLQASKYNTTVIVIPIKATHLRSIAVNLVTRATRTCARTHIPRRYSPARSFLRGPSSAATSWWSS